MSAEPTGLSADEAARRLRIDGPNTVPLAPGRPAWRRLAAQMTHFFATMLWLAGGLAIVAGLAQLGVAIFVVVVVNGVFSFIQEDRAERAAERLRDLLPRRATVRRDGRRVTLDAADLVLGDVVLLEAGDRVSADLEIHRAHGLLADTSLLTGESEPVRVEEGALLHAGAFVVEGEAAGVVVATGGRTRLGGLAELTRAEHRPSSPLARELERVVRQVALIAVAVGVGFFGLAVMLGTPARDGLLFAIGVTVALVPEGLLPTVTLSLAGGAQRMAHRRALVRRLESVESLGSTTFICTDKTGTLTRNEMQAVQVWTPLGPVAVEGTGYGPRAEVAGDGRARGAAAEVARAAARCSTGRAVAIGDRWVAEGDPMEAALDALAARLGVDVAADAAAAPLLARFPFDPRRRRMSVIAGGLLLVKGAPDVVLPLCVPAPAGAPAPAGVPASPPTSVPAQSSPSVACPGPDLLAARAALDAMAGAGLRVLAVAARPIAGPSPSQSDIDSAERGLSLLGLVGLHDPPRTGAQEAIAACRRAGIRVAMITGDHPATAAAVARSVDLATVGSPVLEGSDLPADEQLLGALVDRDGVVLARVAPEDKLRIALALQARGHVVAMTGDGVNDGPALQAADIGVAMGASGTDVAREAADLVLLDDDFATIVAAVEQGRATYANVRRFLTYHLTDNVAELTPFVIWALSGGRFPLALSVLQILCLDIGTDLLPALALGAEPARPHVMERPPEQRHLLHRGVLRRVFGVLGPVEAALEMLAFLTGLWVAGWRPGETFPTGHALAAASGAAFAAVVVGQMANAFACRSTSRPPWRLGWGSNPLLAAAVATEGALLVGFLWVPTVADVLQHAPPAAAAGLVALTTAPVLLAVDALDKRRTNAARRRSAAPRGGRGGGGRRVIQ